MKKDNWYVHNYSLSFSVYSKNSEAHTISKSRIVNEILDRAGAILLDMLAIDGNVILKLEGIHTAPDLNPRQKAKTE